MPQPKYFIASEKCIESKATGLLTLVNLVDELRFTDDISKIGPSAVPAPPLVELVFLSKWERLPLDEDSDVFECTLELHKPFQKGFDPPNKSEFSFKDKKLQNFIVNVLGPIKIPAELPEPPYEYRVRINIRKKGSTGPWISDEIAIPLRGIGESEKE